MNTYQLKANHMKLSHIVLLSSITLLAIISTALFTHLNELPTNPTSKTLSTLTLVGVMGSRAFPVTIQGAGAATGSSPYQDSEVLVMEHREGNTSRIYYLYSPGFQREMLMTKSSGNGYVCGLTLGEINNAYVNSLRVEIHGKPLRMSREGSEYDLLNVTVIRILDTYRVPLVVTHSININGTIQTVEDLGRVSLPQRFIVERGQSPSSIRVHSYRMVLNVGDAIGFEFNSTQQIGFRIYAPDEQLSHIWYMENTTHLIYGLIALKSGTYDFVFTSVSPIDANVTFDAWRVKWDTSDVLFRESGGSSGGMGGIAWDSGYLEPLPKRIVVGRTWYGQYWTDRSISFEATLWEGTEITYEYNATEPVIFSFTSDSGPVISHDYVYSYQNTFKAPTTGKYTFSFDIGESRTAIVSFRCRVANASILSYPGHAAALISNPQMGEVKFDYPFPPAINRTRTITGKLGSSALPDVNGKMMTIKSEDSVNKTFFLHLGTASELIPVPVEGFTMLGQVTVTDLNNAYLGNSTISVTGFPFQINLYEVVYDLFHVNSIEIIGPYPLYAMQSNDGDKIEYFPIRFNFVFERFYHSFLKQGATIRISFNVSKPIEFGFYSDTYNAYLPSIIPFSLGKPSDYFIRESGVQSFEQLFKVPRSGFYIFAFKESGGVEPSVIIDVNMIK